MITNGNDNLLKKPSSTRCSTRESDLSRVMKDFESLMTEVYPGNWKLPRGNLSDMSSSIPKLKAELSRPLESLSPSASRVDFSVAGSLFLARKVLPTPSDPTTLLTDYVSKMGREQTPNTDFRRFAAREVARLFPKGWDSRYVEYCGRALPSAGSSFGSSRKRGGARGEIKRKMSRSSFVEACRTGRGIKILDRRRVKLVDDNGKTRIVSVADAMQQILLPLHHLIYDHLSVEKWLLRGEATANSFKEFDRVPGEFFVSADYEAATDNLNRWHSEFILELILRSSAIPESIQQLALSTLSGYLVIEEDTCPGVAGVYPQIAGQLMGNTLSFPLLCVTNYLAIKFAIPRKNMPLRINGDDAAFRCTLNEYNRFEQVVTDTGLTLSKGKTIVHWRFFSMNSCFFEARNSRQPSLVPVIRAKAIYMPMTQGDATQMKSRLYSSCKGLQGWQRTKVRGHILKFHRKAGRALGCSLNRALGITVRHEALEYAGLLDQEYHYLSAPARLDKPRRVDLGEMDKGENPASDGVGYSLPVPILSKKDEDQRVTTGFRQIPAKLVNAKLRETYSAVWGEHCLEYAWQCGTGPGLEIEFAPPVYGFCSYPKTWKCAGLLGVSKRALGKMLRAVNRKNPYISRYLYDRRIERGAQRQYIWVPEGEVKGVYSASKFRRGKDAF